MQIEQLQADYRLLYKTLRQEGQMRSLVFPSNHPKRKEKLEEIGAALAALARIKELLKQHLQVDPDKPTVEQQLPLVDLPPERKKYR